MNIRISGRSAIVRPAQARPRQSGEHGGLRHRGGPCGAGPPSGGAGADPTDGLIVDVPAGVYHPLPDSSSEFFIRNIKAMNPNSIAKTLEIGAGCGIISLFIAANWTSRTVATDISPIAVQATLDNARLNNLSLTAYQSDLFEKIDERELRSHRLQYADDRQEPRERH